LSVDMATLACPPLHCLKLRGSNTAMAPRHGVSPAGFPTFVFVRILRPGKKRLSKKLVGNPGGPGHRWSSSDSVSIRQSI